MKKAQPGDIFEMETAAGFAYIHFISRSKENIDTIRILPGCYDARPANLDILVRQKERYILLFLVDFAVRKKYFILCGNSPSDDFELPRYRRAPDWVKEEFRGWLIQDIKTGKYRLTQKLTTSEIQYPPLSIYGPDHLKEKIETDWSLDKWRLVGGDPGAAGGIGLEIGR